MEISRELYIEIFKPDTSMITLDEYDVILEDEILYLRNRHTLFNADEICVYKAASKCKEWAAKLDAYDERDPDGYNLSSWMQVNPNHGYCEVDKPFQHFYANTEPEAIFKACEWIKDNK